MRNFVVLFFLIVGPYFLYAQQPLSLARAIEIGLQKNFDVQIQKLEIDIATGNNTIGMAGMLPLVNLNANQNNNITYRQPANPFAVPGQNISDNLIGQLDVQFVLFDGFFIRVSKRRLEQLEALSYGNATLVIEGTIQSIILGYYQALMERERTVLRKRVMDFSRERFDYVKLRKELGGAITFDVLQAQNDYLTDSTNYLLQELTYKNTLRNLNLVLNEDLETAYELTDSLEFLDEAYQFDDLQRKMSSTNTNLRNQFINQELLRLATRAALSDRYPTITLNVGANGSLDRLNANFGSNTGPDVTNVVGYLNGDVNSPVTNTVPSRILVNQTNDGYSYGAYGNFTMRYTLFNGGQIKRNIENAQVREKIAQLDIDQLKLSLKNDLLITFDQYNLLRQVANIANIKLKAAELNLELGNERYKNGALSAIDLRIVQEAYQNSALENYQAIFSVLASKTDLIRLTGGLVDQYEARPTKK
ncbi:MAG: TolC family protein [Cyclobacteriaceae bacterium]|nr:TolC family protein [Cyclobacteriaceae bacterium]UYN87084.1 MAG: TolC family protein [Cyclobacteriaceae bacterium]